MFFGENTYCISEFDEATLYRIGHVQKHVQILMGGFNPPEKYEFVSWEYSSQYMESHKIPWFQITNQNMFNGDSGLPTAFNTSLPAVRRDEAISSCRFVQNRRAESQFHQSQRYNQVQRYNLSCKFGDVAVPEMTLFVLNFALQI